MIVLPPYLYDREIYHQISPSKRLFMNKLWLSEQLGYVCGPTGVAPPKGADLCVRPIMNIFGGGEGGFYWFNSESPQDIEGLKNDPGYFWCERFDGVITYTEFINDVPVFSESAVTKDRINHWKKTTRHIVMPDFIKGISRYVLLEAIGNKVIEVSWRLMGVNARQEVIEDYRTIDPTYAPTGIRFGLFDSIMVKADTTHERGWKWADRYPEENEV